MLRMKKINIDYFFELFEKNSIPHIFPKINLNGGEYLENPNYNIGSAENKDSIFSVFFIPDYLKPELSTDKVVVRKVEQFFKGYAIFLEDFVNADAYVKHRFRSNAKAIRRRVKRLETCFDISYKTFYGEIKKEEYSFLMDCLHKMLVKRFEERNDTSQSLLRWDHYVKMYFDLINEKRASLFVIYDKDKPIVVSLNHHFKERLFSAISSYDIDFRKFSLGSIEIYKKLDWCILNEHKSYEMGMGDLSYKREWCNHIYNFEHHVIYPKGSFLGFTKGTIEYLKVSLKEFVFKKTYVRYKKYKARKKQNLGNTKTDISLTALPIAALEEYSENYPVIDYNDSKYNFLRKMVYDFLYMAIENVSKVKVVKVPKEENTFLILGSSKMQKIICR